MSQAASKTRQRKGTRSSAGPRRSPAKSTGERAPATIKLPRVVIEDVRPRVDDGRHPVKRLLGDTVEVTTDIYKDGHDVIAARICYWAPGADEPCYAALAHDYDCDRWAGRFVVDQIGRWSFAIQAWPDRFHSWRADLFKRAQAGQDLGSELLEGAAVVSEACRHCPAEALQALEGFARRLQDTRLSNEERLQVASDDTLSRLMRGAVDEDLITTSQIRLDVQVDRRLAGFAAWYELFPRSQSGSPQRHGTFADACRQLPRLKDLGFDVVYLPPIHPIGQTKRKGPNNSLVCGPADPGSPWAIGSNHGGHTAIEPALGTLADFKTFLTEARALDMEVALDYALQCSPDHPWLKEHPEWFYHRPDGTIKHAENPPKKYEDIYPLNMWCADREKLWAACADILRYWIDQGVRIFRVDNPHTKPMVFWEQTLQAIGAEHPEVIFLSEAFTRPKRMKGLAKLGFTQSYTYFTWKNSAIELTEYFDELANSAMVEYFRGNLFVNTPDILHAYLQQGGRPAFRVRLLLAATLAPLYGMYSGFELCENVPVRQGSEEYLNSEKYEIRARNYEAPGNINEDIRALNRIRREQPALQVMDNLTFHRSENSQILFYHKATPGQDLLIAANLDPRNVQETMVHVPLADLNIAEHQPYSVEDLLTGVTYPWQGTRNYIRLNPAEQVGHIFRVHR